MPPKSQKDILVLHPGTNAVDVEEFEAARKNSATVDRLFKEKVAPSKAPEADPQRFGKPKLELWGKPGPDSGFLLKLPVDDALMLIERTENTDLLMEWTHECSPAKDGAIYQALQKRIKEVAALIEGVSNN